MCVGGGGATPTQIQGYFHFRQYLGLIRTLLFPGRMVPNLVRRDCTSIPLKILHLHMILYYYTKNITIIDRVIRRRNYGSVNTVIAIVTKSAPTLSTSLTGVVVVTSRQYAYYVRCVRKFPRDVLGTPELHAASPQRCKRRGTTGDNSG